MPISSSDEDNPSRSRHGDANSPLFSSPIVRRQLVAGDAGESVDVAHDAWTCCGPTPDPAKRGSDKSISAWTVDASAGGKKTMSVSPEDLAPRSDVRRRWPGNPSVE